MDNNNSNNNQGENVKSKAGLIVGILIFVLVLISALFFYNRCSDIGTSASEKTLEELAKAKENADKHKDDSNSDADNNNAENTNGNTEEITGDAAEDADDSENNEPILAPDFTVYTADGEAVTFKSKLGKPVIINFWATWCGPCKNEMPHFEKAYKEYGDQIEFMMINPTDGVNDTHQSVNKFLSDYGYTFPVYRDTTTEAASLYGISAFPTTFFITGEGYLLGYYPGMMDEETLYACIDIVLEN